MSEQVQPFEAVAREYCARIEGHSRTTCGELLFGLLPLLSEVLAKGHSLPTVGADADSASVSIEHQEWQRLYASLSSLLGGLNQYAYREPYSFDDADLLVGSLADDLADIWRDLSGGIRALDSGAPVDAVVWDWKFSLQSHWGAHAADALRVLQHLHSACALDGFPESSESIMDGMVR